MVTLTAKGLKFQRWQVLLASATLLGVTAFAASFIGAASLTPEQIFALRLPRILLAILVGASLASSGTCLQALFRNPLADPFILGISAGGALGAASALLFGAPSLLPCLLRWQLGLF